MASKSRPASLDASVELPPTPNKLPPTEQLEATAVALREDGRRMLRHSWPRTRFQPFPDREFDEEMMVAVASRHLRITDIEWGPLIGEGFFGRVYKAHHRAANRTIVLKELKRNHEQRDAFIEEMKILKSLAHPNVLEYIGIFCQGRKLYLVTEYVSGGTLDRLAQDHTRDLPWDLRTRMALDLASGMEYVHSKNILHRDLKSANCMVRAEDMSVVIVDFGLARVMKGRTLSLRRPPPIRRSASSKTNRRFSSHDLSCSMMHTSPHANKVASSHTSGLRLAPPGTGSEGSTPRPSSRPYSEMRPMSIVGSPYWMAPEMMTGEYGFAADVFAFGPVALAVCCSSCACSSVCWLCFSRVCCCFKLLLSLQATTTRAPSPLAPCLLITDVPANHPPPCPPSCNTSARPGIVMCELIGRISADPDVMPRTPSFGVDEKRFADMHARGCPPDLLTLVFQCCKTNPRERPSFELAASRLRSMCIKMQPEICLKPPLVGTPRVQKRRSRIAGDIIPGSPASFRRGARRSAPSLHIDRSLQPPKPAVHALQVNEQRLRSRSTMNRRLRLLRHRSENSDSGVSDVTTGTTTSAASSTTANAPSADKWGQTQPHARTHARSTTAAAATATAAAEGDGMAVQDGDSRRQEAHTALLGHDASEGSASGANGTNGANGVRAHRSTLPFVGAECRSADPRLQTFGDAFAFNDDEDDDDDDCCDVICTGVVDDADGDGGVNGMVEAGAHLLLRDNTEEQGQQQQQQQHGAVMCGGRVLLQRPPQRRGHKANTAATVAVPNGCSLPQLSNASSDNTNDAGRSDVGGARGGMDVDQPQPQPHQDEQQRRHPQHQYQHPQPQQHQRHRQHLSYPTHSKDALLKSDIRVSFV
ncbi:TKL/LISK/LIMK protein kinase [Salpingoeca rosetta]|uniref:TKL/LISK/LIMK protein kinase n=1 Tax=Salpingoeca rosetta (strain ATCC 50818 / BSB-021) TaxID=946362 RepID=F2UKU9_SALR5|nr:TKL/LISK/LIMK protein kinase [Salpingoeca rosetta]EGD77748.1 TKL/LISK/LIMK protein kinase [Salpingoeca rosetta]|eukprot:XP_004990224.1 TKL/LISK/LIMK protein kinase [Salpingoeca rosetta]